MGMGILFTAIDPQDHAAIQEYVESLPPPPKTKSATSKLAL
jgi:hypothetical protein